MLKELCEFMKNKKGIQIVLSVVLLTAVTAIACNVDTVVKKEPETITESEEKVSNGKVVVIDPGHGGADPGKVGVNGSLEKDINLAIAKVLKQELERGGYKVVLTRDKDIVLSEGSKFSKVGDLNARCKTINDTYASNNECVMISIHQNSFTSPTVHGTQCFYYAQSENSKKLAEILQNNFNEKINTHKAKKSKPNNSYYMLINSDCPGIIIECGFLSNSEEESNLTNPDYQKELSNIIRVGVDAYFGI